MFVKENLDRNKKSGDIKDEDIYLIMKNLNLKKIRNATRCNNRNNLLHLTSL